MYIAALSSYPPKTSFYITNMGILFSNLASFICSFLVCTQFHVGILAASQGVGYVNYRTKQMITVIVIAVLVCALLIYISTEMELQNAAASLYSVVGAAILSISRIFVAAYCLWGTKRALRIFEAGGQRENIDHICKRLKSVSFFNVCLIFVTAAQALPQTFLYNHGWIALTAGITLNNILTLVDLSAIPAKRPRDQVVESHFKKKNIISPQRNRRDLEAPLKGSILLSHASQDSRSPNEASASKSPF
jgi:hypothetical protein